jgi:hypothetical protein
MTSTTRSLQICWVLNPTSLKFSDINKISPRSETNHTQAFKKPDDSKVCDQKHSNINRDKIITVHRKTLFLKG